MKQIRSKTNMFLFFAATVCFVAMGVRVLTADAAPSDMVWDDVIGAKVQVTEDSGTPWKSWYQPHCQPTFATVVNGNSLEDYRQWRSVCYVSSGHAQLAVYQEDWGETHYALKYDGDTVFHRITTMTPNPPNFTLLSDDTLIGALRNSPMMSFANVRTQVDGGAPYEGSAFDIPQYVFNFGSADLFSDNEGSHFPAQYIAVSKNEHFAVAQVPHYGLMRVNLRTRETKIIASDWENNSSSVVLAISNDGSTVAVTGNGSTKHRIYTDLDNCGVSAFQLIQWDKQMCRFADFTDQITPQLSYGTIHDSEFSDDGRSFTVYVWNEAEQKSRKVVLTPDPDSYRLDYLALGDSYTSGEGDIGRDANGRTYYLPGTDSGEDDCHISSRSYPFLLRNEWSIANDRMKSVACSGAQVMPDYDGNPINYRGQENRLRDKPDINAAKQQALTNFTPGYVPQLEFVKKYQPKLLTLTGGGNDVGFANILSYCLAPPYDRNNLAMLLFTFADCDYAVKGSDLNKLLYRTIDTQYGYTKKLIQDMQSASPTTKIVLVGYPSFVVSNASLLCTPSAGFLSGAEATMMNDMVDYMNSMLRRAANDMGITYVDITHALDGGRICEGSKYMTDVWKNLTGYAEESERFHPNAQGHQRIASVIERANINTRNDDTSDAGAYEPPSEQSSAIQTQLVDNGVTVKIFGLNIHIGPDVLAPTSIFKITIHSTPKQLGTFTTHSNGSSTLHLPLDDVSIGRHVLVIDGVDREGNPIELYQFVEIKASENDADGDGIPDADDPCQYIVEWYDETTGENICAPKRILSLGGYGVTANTRQMVDNTSQDFVLESHLDSLSEPTKHATITNKPETENRQTASINGIMIGIVAMVFLSITGGARYAYRKSKQG